MAGRKPALPPRKRLRAFIGMVLAPVLVALGATLIGVGISVANGARDLKARDLGAIWAVVALVSLVFVLLLGWPFQAIAFRRRWRSASTYFVAGAAGGGLIGAALFALFWVQTRTSWEMDGPAALLAAGALFAAITVLPGLMIGWLFWLIRRPDQDHDADPLHVFD